MTYNSAYTLFQTPFAERLRDDLFFRVNQELARGRRRRPNITQYRAQDLFRCVRAQRGICNI